MQHNFNNDDDEGGGGGSGFRLALDVQELNLVCRI